MRALGLAALLGLSTAAFAQDWPQWGGVSRDFHVATKGLAATWPEGGPKRLWSRPLGEGHSAILAAGGVLYTMYGTGTDDVVVALDAATGRTLWEQRSSAAHDKMDFEYGKGPHSTPLLSGDRLFAVGTTGKLHALDPKTGKVLWSHDLWSEYHGSFEDRGYAPSPIAYKDLVILQVGGKGQALMAFRQADGSVAWKQHDFMTSPSSPVLIQLGGKDQLVAFLGDRIAGLDPAGGGLLWSYPHATQWGLNISTPVWGADRILLCSSAYNGGTRALKLVPGDGGTTAGELWFNNKIRVHHGNVVRLGDLAVGSSGDFGPAFLAGFDVHSGEILWQERGFSKATLLEAEGRLLILDEDGRLTLASASRTGLKVLAQAPLLSRTAWTVPTLSGTKLYLRDRKQILAVELGAS